MVDSADFVRDLATAFASCVSLLLVLLDVKVDMLSNLYNYRQTNIKEEPLDGKKRKCINTHKLTVHMLVREMERLFSHDLSSINAYKCYDILELPL